jgi:hypothetical protein
VREKNDLLQWFKFSGGIIETAKSSISTFDNILKLQKQVDKIQSWAAERQTHRRSSITCINVR